MDRTTNVLTIIAISGLSPGPLPLLFVDALFKSHPDPTLRPRAVALISFYLLAWSPLFWNYGYRSDSCLSKRWMDQQGWIGLIHSFLLSRTHPTQPRRPQPREPADAPPQQKGRGQQQRLRRWRQGQTPGKPPAATPAAGGIAGGEAGAEPSHARVHPGRRRGAGAAGAEVSARAMHSLIPASIERPSPSLLTSCPPPYARLFLGEGAPLSSIFDGLKTMGQAYVPCVLLVLAGSLAQGLEGCVRGESSSYSRSDPRYKYTHQTTHIRNNNDNHHAGSTPLSCAARAS